MTQAIAAQTAESRGEFRDGETPSPPGLFKTGVQIVKAVDPAIEVFYNPILDESKQIPEWYFTCGQTEHKLRSSSANWCGVYAICNTLKPKLYIGGSIHIYHRWRTHLRKLRLKEHRTPKLQNDWASDSYRSFILCVLNICPRTQIEHQEDFWIAACNAHTPGCIYNKYLQSRYSLFTEFYKKMQQEAS